MKETVYDEATGKAKSALRFEQQDKGPPNLKPNPAGRPVSEVLLFAHGKMRLKVKTSAWRAAIRGRN